MIPPSDAALLASTPPDAAVPVLTDPAAVLAVLLSVLAMIFWATQQRAMQPFFRIVPALVLCYFIPTTLTTAGVLPAESALYDWVKSHVLPAALFLLILSLDLPGIIRLGPKAIIMLLAGTFGVVIGGPIALAIGQTFLHGPVWGLPDDAWQGFAALSGSWIGGGANFVAIGDVVGASESMIAAMVVPDVLVASLWMGVLLYLAGRQHEIDARTGADASMIRDLETRLSDFQERVMRVATLPDLMIIVALGFGASWLSAELGAYIASNTETWGSFNDIISAGTWKYILVTTFGVLLSFTPARQLEGAGASKIGSVMLYLLVACIGAHADFREVLEAPGYIVVGLMWMAIHIIVLLTVAWLIRAPIFFVAVGSQANIGGAASAPVVAAAYHPSLAPVGVLLAVAGYVLGTYAGLVCARLLRMVAGA